MPAGRRGHGAEPDGGFIVGTGQGAPVLHRELGLAAARKPREDGKVALLVGPEAEVERLDQLAGEGEFALAGCRLDPLHDRLRVAARKPRGGP